MDSGFTNLVSQWLQDHYIELLATISGFIYLILSIRENIWLWFFGLCTSVLYVYVFYVARIYADMGINGYYVLISIYGWYHWNFGKNKTAKELPVNRLNSRLGIVLLLLSLILFVFIAYILERFTNSDIATWDAFTTAFSITATWMLARKIAEHWLVWVVVDLISMGLYIYKGLYPTAGLFLVYTVLAVIGYRQWTSHFKLQRKEP